MDTPLCAWKTPWTQQDEQLTSTFMAQYTITDIDYAKISRYIYQLVIILLK